MVHICVKVFEINLKKKEKKYTDTANILIKIEFLKYKE